MKLAAALALITAALVAIVASQPARVQTTGKQPSGAVLLPTGWSVLPAGKQTAVDTFPMSTALSKDGKHLLVLNGGYNPPSVSAIEVATGQELSRTRVADGWLGLVFSPDGRKAYVGGGARASVFEFDYSGGQLKPARTFTVVEKPEHQDFIGDVQISPDGRLIYASLLYRDTIVVINPQSGRTIERFKTGRRPYRILFHPDGKSFFVTSWADGTLYHYNASNGEQLGRVRLGAHTTDMVLSDRKPEAPEIEEKKEEAPYAFRIFVTAGNTNRVFVVGVTEGNDLRVVETINVALSPRQPAGMTPSGLALSPDKKRLVVVCSDANAVAVVDISMTRSQVRGFLPTGWYPTAARVLANGRLLVLNGRGGGSFPNPNGPRPDRVATKSHEGIRNDQYVGTIQRGTISWIDPLTPEQLESYTKTVFANSPYRDALLDDARVPRGNPIPSKPGDPTPIEHVVYIVKENRTYDQVLGDLGRGNGDPSLMLFDEKSSPNHHKLAREFVLLDNFYVNADVSADGHNWTLAAIAPDYVQRLWPNSYGGRRKHYDYEGGEPSAIPPAGYIWTNVLAAGLTMRNYGYFVTNRKPPVTGDDQVETIRDPQLAPVTNRKYRGFDMDYPDVDRAKVFLNDIAEFEKQGKMPRFLLVRLGNDHTSGTAAGKIAPLAAMADNDYATGMIVEGLSKSSFWPKTAVFILEDDAQSGADHVDSHRSPAYVLSPYTRRTAVDSTMYNTTSMLRTMELLLGLRPMTHFDAGAKPMFAAFASKPDFTPYVAEKPRIPLDTRNPANTTTAARSARLDFSEADRIDDEELNDILWRAIRNNEPPAPVRSYFSR
ncbi:MAG TPA: bifunctional YncE family protein/alkaline phosphatase family protein [Bryobacteraceae bacterium]|nr:bifunctional YncE family protein/alkaline phosphatase family protein [Bryobacteraceae bacterium]